ncbi:flagellar basal body P-ring protein FlgI [bacterium]|nr:flagellar basal body P-ring protein FlgI [bacterium]
MRYIVALFLIFTIIPLWGARVKDISTIKGIRSNDLIGYGIVVGLDGTGDDDKAKFTIKSLATMLQKMGIKVDSGSLKVKNVAAVMVTAKLPPFSRVGDKIDVEVSSIGNAKSLNGGVLLMTPLKGADGQIYGLAQGNISITGYSAEGKNGSKNIKNHNTVGRVPNGATIEKELKNNTLQQKSIELTLQKPDFTTAYRVMQTINEQLGGEFASATDLNGIKISIPEQYQNQIVKLIAIVENLEIKVDIKAKIVINERTGTIIIGDNVTISSVAIAHGNLNIIIEERKDTSQPLPFSFGETTEEDISRVEIKEDKANFSLIQDKVTLKDLVQALNALGATPRDLISIIQAIKEAGALHAELELL